MSREIDRYLAAAHRVQTAISMTIAVELSWLDERLRYVLKHQRVGIDTLKAEQGGLATLLIQKKVFTVEEYEEAITTSMEAEAERQQEELQKAMGPNTKIRTL